jgi:hypothetical protein
MTNASGEIGKLRDSVWLVSLTPQASREPLQHLHPHVTIPHESIWRFLAGSRCSSGRLAGVASLQLNQSRVRERPAVSDH